MSEHVTGGESVAGDIETSPRQPTKLVIESEILLSMPLQARALERLSERECMRFRRSRTLLAAGGGVRALALADIPLAGLGVYEALLAQSWAERFADPAAMVHLAEAAAEVAKGFDPRSYGAGRVADLQARAWGELANAYRAADRLGSAQQAFGQAYALLLKGTGDLYLKARLFALEASLLGNWRSFSLALRRLESLSNMYRDLGEPHLAGRVLITRALYTSYSGEAQEALQLNSQGLALIDRQRDPNLYMLAVHNHLLYLADLGRYHRANRLLFETRRNPIYRDRLFALRLRGIEGRINYGLGKLVSAEIAFREERDGMLEAGMTFHGAVISLELAMVLLSQGRIEEAAEEVSAAREIFLAHEIYREYLGAMLYLEECIRRREATSDLIEAIVAFLRRQELFGPHPNKQL